MGLCKCPKRNPTTLFCYEHAVNVCEHCIVINHEKCIVQSYLDWLHDNDYKPNCEICGDLLQKEDCIRLICYHVFHWKCLNSNIEKKITSNPSEIITFRCPTCRIPIIPKENMMSPVAVALREKLLTISSMKMGDLVKTVNLKPSNSQRNKVTFPIKKKVSFLPKSKDFVLLVDDNFSAKQDKDIQMPRRTFQGKFCSNYAVSDEDQSKYKRRNPILNIIHLPKSIIRKFCSSKTSWKWILIIFLVLFISSFVLFTAREHEYIS